MNKKKNQRWNMYYLVFWWKGKKHEFGPSDEKNKKTARKNKSKVFYDNSPDIG